MAGAWQKQLGEAQRLVEDAAAAAQKAEGQSEKDAARTIASCRRKEKTFATKLGQLEELLGHETDNMSITEAEASRRSDVLRTLKARHQSILSQLQGPRRQLDAQPAAPAIPETGPQHDSAEGMLGRQQQIMAEQDQEIDSLSTVIGSTKHIAFAINDELSLQERLLGDLEEDVDHTQSRLKFATAKLKKLSEKSKMFWFILCFGILFILLVVIALFGFKVVPMGNNKPHGQ